MSSCLSGVFSLSLCLGVSKGDKWWKHDIESQFINSLHVRTRTNTHTRTHTCTTKAHVHIPGQKQHTSLSENLWMEKWFNTLGGAANFLRFFLKGLEELIVCLSVCQSAGNVFVYGPYQSVSLFACMSVCLAVFLCLSACLPVRLFLFVYLSVWASTCLSASPLLFCLNLNLPTCLSSCFSLCLSAWQPV